MDFFADIPLTFLILLAFVFGLAIGSFLNVVIHRVPLGEPLVWPGSRCPHCQAAIRPWDNLPLLSYLWLRGHCRQCGQTIAWRYPAVELLTAVVFALLVWRFGLDWLVLAQMSFAAVMISLMFIDAAHQLLPDVINYPLYLCALALAPLRNGWGAALTEQSRTSASLLGPDSDFVLWQAALYGALILALAVPSFWLLDWLDGVLFDRYFEEEDVAGEPPTLPPAEHAAELVELKHAEQRERKRSRVLLGTLLSGFGLAAVWLVLAYTYAPAHVYTYQRAYEGLTHALLSAAGAAGMVWALRAVYFLVRGLEGMGLGDVKLMAALGAFFGWYGAFGVLLYSSILAAVVGLILTRMHRAGPNTAFPFGVFLGAMAIATLFAN